VEEEAACTSSKLERGFQSACTDLSAERRFVVYPGTDSYPLGEAVAAVPLPTLIEEVEGGGRAG
jgi:hypothetical protein